ncbi:MAG TPA: RIP metalloprotease RseP [Spirochaetota bacterium]|nr:RIP metalloprotease RseP [Spirochaetota bacterium]HOD13293.1 RIP metalloprotease RseP [Spirochaetota bacterium]HPG51122.1 RIP metalloprotease RseP [Spirochaetota bacterium]HPN10794.1 RIP metalloprotease RseP [Spirochaetota bacterium]
MVVFTYIAAGIILLGVCIFVHELGHLLGGKLVGIKAKTFSIGYGKGIIKKTIGDTTYQIAPIPLGGYCQFYGEDPSEERSGKGYEFLSAHPMKRIVTVAAGPLFNLFFGIIIFFVMNMVGYDKDTNRVHIPESLTTGKHISAAYAAGIRSGDRVLKIGDKEIVSFSDIQAAALFSEGERLDVAVEREGKPMKFLVAPARQEASGRYEMGLMPYGSRILVVELVEGGAAEAAGLKEMDEIVSINGTAVKSEAEFSKMVQARAGTQLTFSVLRKKAVMEKKITPRLVDVVNFQAMDAKGKTGETLTLMNSKSLKKYLSKGSILINGRSARSYDELLRMVTGNQGKKISFEIDGDTYTGTAVIEKVGQIGIFQAVAPEQVWIQYRPGKALVQAFIEPYEFIVMNLKGLGMLFTGKMNVRENLSGPIRIGKIAGDVFYYKGVPDFILLMAKISIILMVMNLLPIPVVDGSHIIFFTVEMIRRKPLSQKVMERIQTVGIVILIMLSAFVILNDISMLPVIQNLFR